MPASCTHVATFLPADCQNVMHLPGMCMAYLDAPFLHVSSVFFDAAFSLIFLRFLYALIRPDILLLPILPAALPSFLHACHAYACRLLLAAGGRLC